MIYQSRADVYTVYRVVARCVIHYAVQKLIFFLMMRRPPRSTLDRSSAASDVYKRQVEGGGREVRFRTVVLARRHDREAPVRAADARALTLSLIHISEPTRPY